MPKYIYSAKSSPNKAFSGEIEAESEQDALNKLNQSGCFPIWVRPEDTDYQRRSLLSFKRISRKDIASCTHHLATLLESGINILKSLSILAKQTDNKYLRAVLEEISSQVKNGKSFSESLSGHPELFSSLYVAMVRSGEQGGNVEQAMKRLSDFMEAEQAFKDTVKQALTYPVFLVVISAITVIVLLTYVLPKLVVMFEDMGQALPLPTFILIRTSGFIRQFWWLIVAGIGMIIFLVNRSLRTRQGKTAWDNLTIKFPVVGTITLKTQIARFSRTLSLLLSSGVAMVFSLDIASSVLDNIVLELEVKKYKEKVSAGTSLSQCLQDSPFFPAFVTNIINTGEETGNLEKSLLRIADEYERDAERSLTTLTRMLEPAIILSMGIIVGFIVISMLLPIFELNIIAR